MQVRAPSRPDQSTLVARASPSGISSTHQQKAGRLVLRFNRYLRYRLSVGPPRPPGYVSQPAGFPFVHPVHRRAILSSTILCEVRTTSAFQLYPGVARLTVTTIHASNSCHHNGSLTLLFLPISRHSKNILRSANHSASLSVTSPHPAAWKPRVSLIGSVTVFQDVANTPDEDEIASCYLKRHPDAVHWLPKDKRQPHVVSLTSQQLYFQVFSVIFTIH